MARKMTVRKKKKGIASNSKCPEENQKGFAGKKPVKRAKQRAGDCLSVGSIEGVKKTVLI